MGSAENIVGIKMNRNLVLAFHQFNDYSGSPKVLAMLLSGLSLHNRSIQLFTSKGGCLDELGERVKIQHFYYKFSRSVPLVLLRSFWAQCCMFCYGLKYGSRNSVFLINTIMPVGAALAANILGARCVYYYHENAFAKNIYYRFKAKIMEWLADEIVCVSDYQRRYLKRTANVTVIPNALAENQRLLLKPHSEEAFEKKRILMVSSLKKYKGIVTYVSIAERFPSLDFVLVLNATDAEISEFFRAEGMVVPKNLTVFHKQSDVTPFYNDASLSVNLTDPRYAIETFGLTAIEAMAAGVPVIVPDVGGIADLVADGFNGYKVDPTNIEEICRAVKEIFADRDSYRRLSENAYGYSGRYDEKGYIEKFEKLLYE